MLGRRPEDGEQPTRVSFLIRYLNPPASLPLSLCFSILFLSQGQRSQPQRGRVRASVECVVHELVCVKVSLTVYSVGTTQVYSQTCVCVCVVRDGGSARIHWDALL